MIVTIACPISMTHDGINPDSAPIWVDAEGNEYRVVSGVLDSADGATYGLTANTRATPDGITIVSGLPGLEALAAMGLSVKEVEV